MTGIEVARNARALLSQYRYIYGAKGEWCSAEHVEELIRNSPSYFETESKKTAARANSGYSCADCSGYVSICYGMSAQSSYSLYEIAVERRNLACSNGVWAANGANIPIGAVLWKNKHVGIYVGGQQVVEARSEELNVTMNSLDGRGFTYCLLLSGIQYEENVTDELVMAGSDRDYIPWIGKIINVDCIWPALTYPPTSSAAFTNLLNNGEQVSVIGVIGDYYRIRAVNGRMGYVHSYYVGFMNSPAYENAYISWNGTVYGANDHVNVRQGPAITYPRHSLLPELPNGSMVMVTGETIGADDHKIWYHVKFMGQYYGYIRSDLVTPYMITNYASWYGVANSTTGVVNIRVEATVNSSMSSLHHALSNGDRVTVVNEIRGSDGFRWYQIEIDGIRVGFCRSDLITPYVEGFYNEWNGVLNATTASVNIRKGPGTGYELVAGSPFVNGTMVHVIGEKVATDGYTWYKLTVAGLYTGYARCDLVNTTNMYDPWYATAETGTGTLNIRTGPGTSYGLHNTIPRVTNGTRVKVTDQVCGTDGRVWYKLLVRDMYTGYARGDLLKPISTFAYPVWTGTANSTTGVVNVRRSSSVTSEVIAGYPQLTNGDQFDVIDQVAAEDGYVWFKIRILNRYVGFVRSDLVSHGTMITSSRDYASWIGYVQAGGGNSYVNVRSGAGTGFSVVCAVDNHTNVEVLGTENGTDGYVWYRVQCNGRAGYVRSDLVYHLSSTTSPYTVFSDGRKGVIISATNLYEAPYLTAETIQGLRRGQYVAIDKQVKDLSNGRWYLIDVENGGRGFVPFGAVKVFLKDVNCMEDANDIEGHNFTYPDYDIFVECSKCGYHIEYQKPAKEIRGLRMYDVEDNIDDFFVAGSPVTGIGITLETLYTVLASIERSAGEFFRSRIIAAPGSNADNVGIAYFVINLVCDLARKNGYDTEMWNLVFLEADLLLKRRLEELFNGNVDGLDYIESYLSWVSDLNLIKQIELLFLVDTNNSPTVLIESSVENEEIVSRDYMKLHHFLATLKGYYSWFRAPVPKEWFGWGGDLAHTCGQVQSLSINRYIAAMRLIGQSQESVLIEGCSEAVHSHFMYADIASDIDAIGVAHQVNNVTGDYSEHPLTDALESYYSSSYGNRKDILLEDLGVLTPNPSLIEVSNALNQKLNYASLNYRSVLDFWGDGADSDAVDVVCKIFAQYILTEE